MPSFGGAPNLFDSNSNSARGSQQLHQIQHRDQSRKILATSTTASSRVPTAQAHLWPGTMPVGFPFPSPPVPHGFLPPLIPSPNLVGAQMSNPTSAYLPFPFSSLRHTTCIPSPTKQPCPTPQPGPTINTSVVQTDREEGELSDCDLPTGPASMQRRSQKKALQAGRERNPQVGRMSKKQMKREERRGAALDKVDRDSQPSTQQSHVITTQAPPLNIDARNRHQQIQLSTVVNAQTTDQQIPSNTSLNTTVTVPPTLSCSTRASSFESFPVSNGSSAFPPEYLAERRENAKKFLLLMHHVGYSYDMLSRESLDPSFLTSLYNELGIPAATAPSDVSASAQNALTTLELALKSVPTLRVPTPVTTPVRASGSKRVSIISAAVPPRLEDVTVIPTLSSTSGNSNVLKYAPVSMTRQILDVIPSPQSEPTIPFPKELTTSKPAIQVPDRKEYIARLIAAKTKKPQTQELVEISRSRHDDEAVTPPTISNNVDNSTGRPMMDNPSLLQEEQAKKKAKTELIRLRLEALKAAKQKEVTKELDRVLTNSSIEVANSHSATLRKAGYIKPSSPTRIAEPLDELIENVLKQSSTSGLTSPTDQQAVASKAVAGGIPGLFMTSPSMLEAVVAPSLSVAQSVVSSATATPALRSSIKRPVASDFDDGPLTKVSRGLFGRRAYELEQEGVIIEVSDEEDADSEMDDEEPIGSEMTENTSTAIPSGSVFTGIKTMALPDRPLSGSPAAHKAWQANGTSSNTNQETGHLRLHETKIAEMKRKIVEMELKRKAKAIASRASSPSVIADKHTLTPAPVSVPESNETLIGNVVASHISSTLTTPLSVESETILVADPQPAAKSQSRASNAGSILSPAKEVSNVTSMRMSEAQNEIPLLDASIASDSFRLQALLTQVKDLEEAMRKRKEDRARLVGELERSGVDTNGMPHEELQATKDELDLQRQLALETLDAQEILRESNAESGAHHVESASENESDSESRMSIDSNEVARSRSASQAGEQEQNPMSASVSSHSETSEESLISVADGEQAFENSLGGEVSLLSPADPDLAQLGVLVNSSDPSAEASDMDIDDVYGSEVAQTVNLTVRHSRERSQETGTDLEDVGGPIEDDNTVVKRRQYEEAVIEEVSDALVEVSSNCDDYEPFDALILTTGEAIGGDGSDDEEYEPPEPSAAPEKSPSHDMALAEIVPSVTEPAIPADRLPLAIAANENQQVSERAVNASIQIGTAPKSHFTPYNSPLSLFTSYRFHPNYAQNVSGGYRSLTYSHKIDSQSPMCEYETAGGTCNDSKCEGQHFRTMGLADNMVLVQLGTSNPGRTEEERQRWTEGLKAVVQDLRKKNTKDSEVVAASIAAYRRQFLNDPSRILTL